MAILVLSVIFLAFLFAQRWMQTEYLDIIAQGIVNGWDCGEDWNHRIQKAIHEKESSPTKGEK